MAGIVRKNIALGIYASGIVVSAINGIYDENLKLRQRVEKGYTNTMPVYAINSFGGALIGTYTGLFWPFTVIGQITLKIYDYTDTTSRKN